MAVIHDQITTSTFPDFLSLHHYFSAHPHRVPPLWHRPARFLQSSYCGITLATTGSYGGEHGWRTHARGGSRAVGGKLRSQRLLQFLRPILWWVQLVIQLLFRPVFSDILFSLFANLHCLAMRRVQRFYYSRVGDMAIGILNSLRKILR